LTDPQHPGEPALSALPIFADVLPALYEGARRIEYRDGNPILTSGTAPDRLIVLMSGTVGIYEGDVKIALRPAVRLIGELAFIDQQVRSASVIAEDAVVTREIDAAQVPGLLADPMFCRNLNVELSWKLREATRERSFRYLREERLFGAFRAQAGPELLNQLLERGDLGEPRFTEVVAMFADIRGFTPKVLTMQPEDLMRDLGAFLELGIRLVQDHGGMVDKLIGDEVMGLWGYASSPDDAERAVACALELVDRAAGLTLDGVPLRIGVGLEMGTVTLGVIGSEGKSSFTAVGPAVNLAARLQGETKELHQPICIGPALASRLPEEIRAQLGGPHPRPIRGIDGQTDVWTHAPKE
jgi:class 3 adenylate cyclase